MVERHGLIAGFTGAGYLPAVPPVRLRLVAVTAALLALAGCGAGASPGAAPTAPGAATGPASTAASAPTTTATGSAPAAAMPDAMPDATTGSPGAPHGGHPAATPVTPPPLGPGEQRITIGIAGGPYTPVSRNGASDDYRCFLADPGLTSDRMLTGVTFAPGNPAVVHHAILYRVEPSQVAAARRKDAAEPGVGWGCFGGPGLPAAGTGPASSLDSAPWLAAWAPGGKEQRFPAGTGVPMAAGTQIVLQVHYNLRGGDGPDATEVFLRTVSDRRSLVPLDTMLLPAPVELPCAPGESGPLCQRDAALLDTMRRFGNEEAATIAGLQFLCGGDAVHPRASSTQSCDRNVLEPMTIRAAAGHMHLLGRSIRIETNPGTPRARTVLDVPVWDFDQQGAVPLKRPVSVKPGDRIRVTCTHDATLRAKLPALQGTEPRYVTWGEGTTDEMCLGILLVSRP